MKYIKNHTYSSDNESNNIYNIFDIEKNAVTTCARIDLNEQKDKYIYEKIKSFPKTRFYGSKRRLLPWIYDNLKELNFNTVLDGFGGTASVSLLFKAMGKDVTYNDILTANTISAKTLLLHKIPMSINDAETFIDSIEPIQGTVDKNFKGVFYTDIENQWIDGAIAKIHSLTNNKQKNLMLYCLFQACLMKRPFNIFHRANLNLRTNPNVNRSFGNLTTWNTAFPLLMKKSFWEIYKFIWENETTHKVLDAKPVEKIKQGFDLVYLDPPYVSNKKFGDGYLKKYHFLEGLADYENWEATLNHTIPIKMPLEHRFVKEWEHKLTFKNLLFNLIDKHKESIVVLSYVNHAVPSIKEISDFFETRFSKVTISTYNLNHALAKNMKNEILIIGEP